MGADAALVQGAFKEAQTRAGAQVPNMKPLYDSNRTIGTEPFKAIMGLVEGIAKKDKIYEAGRVKQFSTFRESVLKMHKSLAQDKNSLSHNTIDEVEKAIRALQDEFEAVNTFGNNDNAENEKARYRIEGELNKIIKGTINTRAGFLKIGELINSVNVQGTDPTELAAIKMFIESADNDKDERVTRSMGEDGAMLYTATLPDPKNPDKFITISMNMDAIVAALPMLKPELEAYFIERKSTAMKAARIAGEKTGDQYDFDSEVEKSDILERIKTKEDFQAISARRIGELGPTSFREDLISNPDIQYEVIQSMFVDENGEPNGLEDVFNRLDVAGGADGKGDGIIDEKDAAAMETDALKKQFTANLEDIVNAITRIKHKSFDLEISRNLLAEYYTEKRKENYDGEYSKAHIQSNNRKGMTISPSSTLLIPQSSNIPVAIKVKGREVTIAYRNFQEGNTFKGYKGYNTYTKTADGWEVKKGKYINGEVSQTEFDTVQMSDEAVAKELGFDKYQKELNYDPKTPRPTGKTARQYAEGK